MSTSTEESNIDADYIRKLQRDLFGNEYEAATLSKVSLADDGGSRIVSWLKSNTGMMVIMGSPGCGKTYLCSALIPWMYKKVPSWRFWKESNFLARLRACIQNDQDFGSELRYIADDHFLIYDDLGSSGFNEWRKGVLFELIDYRYSLATPTIFTTNLSRDQLYENLGARAVSRLFDSRNLILDLLKSEDLRQTERKK